MSEQPHIFFRDPIGEKNVVHENPTQRLPLSYTPEPEQRPKSAPPPEPTHTGTNSKDTRPQNLQVMSAGPKPVGGLGVTQSASLLALPCKQTHARPRLRTPSTAPSERQLLGDFVAVWRVIYRRTATR